MATQNGVIETATGDLLRCGRCTFTAGAGETLKDNVPVPGYRRKCGEPGQYDRWNGAAWVKVDQPDFCDCPVVVYSADSNPWKVCVDNEGVLTTEHP